MKRVPSTVLMVVLAAVPGSAQTPAPAKPGASEQAEIRIKAYTKLVQVPVIVTEHGQHVAGLSKEDFVLLEDKTEQKIATFEYVTTSNTPVSFKKLPPGMYSNLLMGGAGARAVSVIVIDTLNTAFPDQAYARRQVIKYLTSKVEPGMLISLMVLTRSGAKVIHEYTTDTSVLIKAVQKMKGRGDTASQADLDVAATAGTDPTESLADQEARELNDFSTNADQTFGSFQRATRMMDTLSALEALANSLAGVPGRKSVIWATGSFPFYFDDRKGFSSSDFSGRMTRLFQALNDANIAIYPVDVRGLVNPEFSGPWVGITGAQARNPGALAQQQVARSNAFRNTLDTLNNAAELTGGVAYYNTNDIAGSIRKAQDDSSSFYLLGYYLKGGEETPRYRKLDVRVRRAGVKVRARKGVFAAPPQGGERQKRSDLAAAERSPLAFTSLAMVVKWKGYEPGAVKQEFEIRLDSADLQIDAESREVNIEVLVVARDAEGKLLDQANRTIAGKIKNEDEFRNKPLLFTDQLHLKAMPATVHFVARDNLSGKMGSVIVEGQ